MAKKAKQGKDKNQERWILKCMRVDLKGEQETMALVQTPAGERVVPLSEAKGKVNLYEQLPEYKKQELCRSILKDYEEWIAEQNSDSSSSTINS